MVIAKTKKVIKSALDKTLTKKKTIIKKSSTTATGAKGGACVKTAVKTKVTEAEDSIKACRDICIDYPKSNEVVYCGHYCFRLGCSKGNAEWMKVSINEGPWQDCRCANGYWWFDWWNFQTGSFTAEALASLNGKQIKTAKRKFKVSL